MSSGATGGQGGQAAPAAEMFPPADVEARIGWRFSKRELLAEALTHSTWANEAPSAPPDNERLEFVGDAVLGLLAARLLYEEPGRQQEGEMSRRRAHVVRRDALARQAERLGLAEHLRMGQGQKAAGVGRRMLADVFEAVVGAVFVDGGFEAAHTCFAPSMADALAKSLRPDDHKTQLQEICHRKGLAAPVYEIVEIRGPDHARIRRQPAHRRNGLSRPRLEQTSR